MDWLALLFGILPMLLGVAIICYVWNSSTTQITAEQMDEYAGEATSLFSVYRDRRFCQINVGKAFIIIGRQR